MHDLERCSEITEGVPSCHLLHNFIDNDDFRNDTLTGGGISHRIKWMLLQRLGRHVQSESNIHDECAREKDAKLCRRH